MIPKIIHYCWFGGKDKPKEVVKCIESWKKHMPEYKIIEWNENNFDITTANQYVREAYACEKWAFVSDYVRLLALYHHGGVYFDTDVEVFQSFDPLLNHSCFMGFESKDYVATAVIGCEKGNTLIETFLESYNSRSFCKSDGLTDTTTNVVMLTKLLERNGLKRNGKEQIICDDVMIYSQKYFAGNDFRNIFGKYRKGIYAYHHYIASWNDHAHGNGKLRLVKRFYVGILRNTIGTDSVSAISRLKGRIGNGKIRNVRR